MQRREQISRLETKRRKAAEMFKSGMGYRKVARLLGVSVYTVKDWSEQFRAGSFRTDLPVHVVGYPDELKEKVVQMHASGMAAYRIAKTLGISNSTCSRWIGNVKL